MQQLYQTGALCRPFVRRSLGRSVTKSNQPVTQYKDRVTKPVTKPHDFVTESVTKPVTKYHPGISGRLTTACCKTVPNPLHAKAAGRKNTPPPPNGRLPTAQGGPPEIPKHKAAKKPESGQDRLLRIRAFNVLRNGKTALRNSCGA